MILRVCDLETNGMKPPAQVCEAAFTDVVQVDGDPWRIGASERFLCHVKEMPPEVRAVHHITLEDVRWAPGFNPKDLVGSAEKVLVAHQADFERAFIGDHDGMLWLCTYKSALRVWPDAPGHSNSVLRYWLEDQGLISLDHDKAMPPHRAGPDAYVTAHILLALLKVATVEEMIEWTKEPRLLPRCPLGKFRGKPWSDVDYGFLTWMLKQADMEADLKWNAKKELDRRDEESRGLPF